MSNEDYFEKINLTEIKMLVDSKQEENVFLEFKTVNHPNYNDKNKNIDKSYFSKCLSGFANSNGGIVIWGIKADQDSNGIDCANDLKPIGQLTKLLNMFNTLEGQAVTPTIKGVRHKKIEDEPDSGYIVTYVPASDSSPHMANFAEKYYYKRNGDSFYRAEHFDVVDMFSRKKEPLLRLTYKNLKKQVVHGTKLRFELIISITNEGKAIAKFPCLSMNASQPFSWETYGLDGNGNTGLKRARNSLKFDLNYMGGSDIVIHPQMTLDIDKIQGEIPKESTPLDLTMNYLIMAENMTSFEGIITISKETLMR
jgi:hypothetical protein